MFSKAEKTNNPIINRSQQNSGPAFFRKAEEESFFGDNKQSPFFSPVAQAKLSISQADDPQEKEADEVAGQVMRMPEPVSVPARVNDEDKLQRQSEEEEEEEPVQAKEEIPRIFRTGNEEKEEEPVQTKFETGSVSRLESADERDRETVNESPGETGIDRKANRIYRSDIIQSSGRGPPAGIMHFENNLHSTKGYGTPLPASTQDFMESRFNADFSNVRIHTGSYAEEMNRSINAQAFTHGKDIYFNSGKYSPHTETGGSLLAHELTHTIQQGSVRTYGSAQSVQALIQNKKDVVQRVPAGPVPQLTNAVELAKSKEGKVNSQKEGPDGYREGWQDLLEFFKTSFGPDKIISGAGGTIVPGAVAVQDIKKKRIMSGVDIVDPENTNRVIKGERDAMPSWCGIFAFWALNKSGVPMPKWKLGIPMIKPEAAYPDGYIPRTGDIAYRQAYSHYAIVESVSGDTVRTVNGNTAGEDNMGGQIQTREHAISNWTGFFNPLIAMEGVLTSGGGVVETKPKTLRELRRELFNVNRMENEESEERNEAVAEKADVHAKPELSGWSVGNDGTLHTNNHPEINRGSREEVRLKEEDDQQQEEEKLDFPREPVSRKEETYDPPVEKDNCCGEPGSSGSVQAKSESLETNSQEEKEEEKTDLSVPVQALKLKKGENGSEEKIQGGWFDRALSYVNSAVDYVAQGLEAGKRLLLREARDFVMAIPGYRALRVVLGEDPITGEEVERNGRNFIEAAFDIIPGGNLLHDKLRQLGALDEAAQWIDNGIAAVERLVAGVVSRVETFWNNLTLESLASPTRIFRDAGNIIHSTINNVVNYAIEAGRELLGIVKRWLLTQIVGFIRERTTAYPLLTVILGRDPITEVEVARNGTNILNALLELGGETGVRQRTQMRETGTFDKVAEWIDRGILVFGNLYETIRNNFGLIWSIVSIDALMNPVAKFTEIYNTFAAPVRDVLRFVADTAVIILRFIKEVLMRRLSNWAKEQRGYFLITVIIGKDPFTDAVVERNTENIIHGFMSLMEGGEAQFQQMKESGAIGRATARISAAVARLNMTPAYIVQLFNGLWNSFGLNDLMHPLQAFARIFRTLSGPIMRLIAFVIEIVKIVVHVILEIMNFPFDLINNIIARTIAAFHLIKADPIGFLKNLLRAIKEGFVRFFNNILTHLINGLVGWLTMELRDAGVPQLNDLSLRGIISWVLEVLGISMEKIWEKLARHPRIGPQRVARIRSMINTLTGIWTFIRDVQERGMAAIWDKIKEQLSNLWNIVLDSVKNWIMERIITQVTARLLSMLDPTGIMAVINSCIAIYRAIQSFIKYLRQMLEIVNSFVEGVAEIASGSIGRAAGFLERTLARGIPIVIGFLANQMGLSGIGRRIGEIIERVRGMVDRALEWLVNKAVDTGMALLDRVMAAGRTAAERVLSLLGLRKVFRLPNGQNHTLRFSNDTPGARLMMESTPTPLEHHIGHLRSTYTSADAVSQLSIIDVNITAINTLKVQTMTPTRGEQIRQKLDAIANVLQHPCFSGNENIPPTKVTFTPTNKAGGPVGHIMDAKPLTLQPGTNNLGGANVGSEPVSSGETELWKKVRIRPNTYIQGHLLNHHVHGSGALKQNLVPIRGPYNSQMERDFESTVKNRVLGNREILHYRVEAVFGGHPGRVHLPEEADLPTALRFTAKSMQKKNNTLSGLEPDHWEETPGAPQLYTGTNPFIHTLEPDSPPAVAATLPLATLTAEANGSTLTFSAFRTQDVIHTRSIDVLAPIDKSNLEKIFTDRQRLQSKLVELNRIERMNSVDDIMTWNAFTMGRAFYNTPDTATDSTGKTVQGEFNLKQAQLRSNAISAATGIVNSAAPGAFAGQNWIDFKVTNKINFRADTSESGQISAIETTFRSKQ